MSDDENLKKRDGSNGDLRRTDQELREIFEGLSSDAQFVAMILCDPRSILLSRTELLRKTDGHCNLEKGLTELTNLRLIQYRTPTKKMECWLASPQRSANPDEKYLGIKKHYERHLADPSAEPWMDEYGWEIVEPGFRKIVLEETDD